MHKTVVIDVAGLTLGLLGTNTPQLLAFAKKGGVAPIDPMLPAVTCPVQATYLTGAYPARHGIVGNGWYFRDECDIKFWRQSNKLVQSPSLWERARSLDPSFTCANLFWWFNMYSSVDFSVTPRPMYPSDGRKIPDLYTRPEDLRKTLQAELGRFPLFDFWGPASSIRSSRWIAEATRRVDESFHPTLTLVYLPHLDYCLQREGPDSDRIAADLREIDAVCGELIEYYRMQAAQVVILSEYGVVPVKRPIHINRTLREAGYLTVRDEMGRELLDAGASIAFAVSDHQIAQVYVNDPGRTTEVRALLLETAGVSEVLDAAGKRANHLDHFRSGDLVAVSEPDAWFTYYYWLDERRAPDFARTVDIHRKPGYDPAELFFDPELRFPKAKAGFRLLQKRLGFRCLMDVVPIDANLVRGSHGRPTMHSEEGPLLISSRADLLDRPVIEAVDVCNLLLRHLDPAIENGAWVRTVRIPAIEKSGIPAE